MSLETVLAAIRQYAIKESLTPEQVLAIFETGIGPAKKLKPEWWPK